MHPMYPEEEDLTPVPVPYTQLSAEALQGVIESFELAYRMQSSVPELMDIKGEPKHVEKVASGSGLAVQDPS